MRLLDSMQIFDLQSQPHMIELWQGDITYTTFYSADILVLSARPGDYYPSPHSLIGALHKKGISVAQLAHDKQEDMRESSFCWVSQPLTSTHPGTPFQQIACYEPPYKIHPADSVGNIFRCLAAHAEKNHSVQNVIMPLVSTGDVGIPIAEMLDPLLEAATHWLKNGLPIQRLSIVEIDEHKAYEIKGAFSVLKKIYQRQPDTIWPQPSYDVFISYSHANTAEADYLREELAAQQKEVRIFLDRLELEPGAAWQKKIFNSLVSCRKVIALYSQEYLKSKACREEYNLAQLLHRQRQNVLFPIYLFDAEPLPEQMTSLQYEDCRPGDKERLKEACGRINQLLG